MLTNKKEREFCFTGPLAGVISHFFEDMRLSGRVYNAEGYYLQILARTAEEMGLEADCMTKEFVDAWCQKREYESHKTWSNRVIAIRKLADYMDLRGMSVHKPSIMIPAKPSDFTPHIYTTSELKRIFEQADRLPFYPNCPNRGPVASLLFRMLYGCGLRISEALNLTVRDVDLDGGVLTIWNSKFGKNRYVPMSPELTERCRRYAALTRDGAPENAPFFRLRMADTIPKERSITHSGVFLKAPGFLVPNRGLVSTTSGTRFPSTVSRNGYWLAKT